VSGGAAGATWGVPDARGLPDPRLTTCPFTGRVGMWTAVREQRPQPRPQRLLLDPDVPRCPFCTFDDPDPRLLPFEAEHEGARWAAMHNIYPPIDGPTGTADLAYAVAHDPTLTHLHADLAAHWAAMLDVQQQLAGRRTDRWSMASAATGRSAGASQHHPHGHVLTPAEVPGLTVELQHRWADPEVPRVLLADDTTVAAVAGVRLVAAPVPLGPFDLWLVPEASERFLAAEPGVLAELVARWVAGVHGQIDVDHEVDARIAPFDAKVVFHPELPDGTGRWWAELMVTDRHAPGVAAVPLVDLRSPPESQARRFRDAIA
jgi:hypothetical protein